MKYIVKNGNQLSLLNVISALPQLPEGFEVIGLEFEVNPNSIELADGELHEGIIIYSHPKTIERKLVEIRAQRDAKLIENDKAFMIALKTDQTLLIDSLKTEAQALRDLPQVAEAAMQDMTLVELNAYNPFEE